MCYFTCGCSVASNWQPDRPCSDLHSNNLQTMELIVVQHECDNNSMMSLVMFSDG